jgi:hypothetical protein
LFCNARIDKTNLKIQDNTGTLKGENMDDAMVFLGQKAVPILIFLFITVPSIMLLVFILREMTRKKLSRKRREEVRIRYRRFRKYLRKKQKQTQKKEPKSSLFHFRKIKHDKN